MPRRSLRGPAVTVRVARSRHGVEMAGVGEQAGGLGDDRVRIRADEQRRPRLYGFGSFRRLAQHEHRLAEGRGLLLDAAGVREHDRRELQRTAEVGVVERLGDVDPVETLERRQQRIPYDRVAMCR